MRVDQPTGYPRNWRPRSARLRLTAQNNLGNAYRDRLKGNRANNIEQAIFCLQQVSIIYTQFFILKRIFPNSG
ncbi:MAG: hypothetical protein QNJ65_18625 [Xenococcaceae cyanobacterium MO_234.B1]|nr:hypothetical protein [Xenococcaceae cyanobacterium MO_234.B1]